MENQAGGKTRKKEKWTYIGRAEYFNAIELGWLWMDDDNHLEFIIEQRSLEI